MFLVSENRKDNYSVLTYAKLAVRESPDMVVIYAQEGDHEEARRFIEQSGIDVFITELPHSEDLEKSIAMREVSPARYSYFMKTLKADPNSKVPQVSRQVLSKDRRKIAFIPGNQLAKKESANRQVFR